MKLRTTILALTTVITVSLTSAANKIPLPYAEFMMMVAINGQTLMKLDYEKKQFEKNNRLYTFDEETDYLCNAVLLAKENLKFIDQYPEYKNTAQTQQISKQLNTLAVQLPPALVKEKRHCKGYPVMMPTYSPPPVSLNSQQTSPNSMDIQNNQQVTRPTLSEQKTSNEQIACGITGMIFRAVDKKAEVNCNK